MLCEFERSSHTLTLPSFPDDMSDFLGMPAMVFTARREVVADSWPGRDCILCRVDLSNISMTFEGAEVKAA